MISIPGLGSGLDISSLVESLVAAERAGTDLQLNRQSAKLQAKFSALGSLKSALSTFQTALGGVVSVATFTRNTATSSDSATLKASADDSAVSASYSVQINQLATAHNLASVAVATADSTPVGTGSITFRFGTTDYDETTDSYNGFVDNGQTSPATILIDSSNNTLQGIMTAINEADIDVTASIVNDGSGYRLLMTSAKTGLENSMQITVSDGDGNNTDPDGLSLLAFNASATNMEQTVTASDARVVINGLNVTSPDNDIDTAIEGLTLSLKKVSAAPIQVTVQPDTAGVKTAVNEFIEGYNQFVALANTLSAYNPETQQAAALIGDFTLRSIEGQINSILRGSLAIQGGNTASLVELGITTTASGTLTIDDAKFSEILEEEPHKVIQMFTLFGAAEDPQITYLGASDKSVEGVYGIEITTLAQSGFLSGASVLPGFIGQGQGNNVQIDQDNDNLTLAIDGIEAAQITLTHDLYTSGESLAAEIQTQINSAAAFTAAGISVSVTYNSATDNLVITSDSTGSTSTVNIVAVDNDTAATLGFTVGSGTDGSDMTGLVGGIPVTATGNIFEVDSGDAQGLRLQINSSTLGSKGDVTVTRGVGSRLDALLEQLLDLEGALSNRIESIDNRIDGIEERRERFELRWQAIRERYLSQFNALDTLLGQLQNTSVFLEQQLGSLLQPNTGNNG